MQPRTATRYRRAHLFAVAAALFGLTAHHADAQPPTSFHTFSFFATDLNGAHVSPQPVVPLDIAPTPMPAGGWESLLPAAVTPGLVLPGDPFRFAFLAPSTGTLLGYTITSPWDAPPLTAPAVSALFTFPAGYAVYYACTGHCAPNGPDQFPPDGTDPIGGPETTVPEPGTWALMAAGCAALFVVRRRRAA